MSAHSFNITKLMSYQFYFRVWIARASKMLIVLVVSKLKFINFSNWDLGFWKSNVLAMRQITILKTSIFI